MEFQVGSVSHLTATIILPQKLFLSGEGHAELSAKLLTEDAPYGSLTLELKKKEAVERDFKIFARIYHEAMQRYDNIKDELLWGGSEQWEEGKEIIRVDCQSCIWQTLIIHEDFLDDFLVLNDRFFFNEE